MVLGRVRESLRQTSARESDYATIPRAYRQRGKLSQEQKIELLIDRLLDYGSGVYRCGRDEIAGVMDAVVGERKKVRLLVTQEIPAEWLAGQGEFLRDEGLSHRELDAIDGAVTRCALAIAETGTIVLRHAAGSGRRALTLIPDYHLCILFEDQIVELVPEAMRTMAGFIPALVTTISGPSATSDIEMTRVQGVHGPRTLDVVLVR